MKRREFFTLLSSAAMWPVAVGAQQAGPVRRIGVLMAHSESDREFKDYADAFRSGLSKLGWTEGRNVRIDFRWGALDDANVRERSARELIALQPDVILTQNTPPTGTMLQQTRNIPVVFVIVADPIGSGFVKSLARPGGNATGFTVMEPTISGKWVQLLKDIAPRISRAAVLFNPATTPYADVYLTPFRAAATALALEAIAAPVHNVSDIENVMTEQARTPNGSLVVIPDGFLNVHRAEIVSMAARHRLPAIYPWRFFPDIGGLLSYGSDQREMFRSAASYVDRILRGEKTSDLPVQAPVKYELVINLKTAKTLELDIPAQVQQLADSLLD